MQVQHIENDFKKHSWLYWHVVHKFMLQQSGRNRDSSSCSIINFNVQISDFLISLNCTLCVVLRLIKCLHIHIMNRVVSVVFTPRCHTPKKMREDAWRCIVSHRFPLTDSHSHPCNDSGSETTQIHSVLHTNIWYWLGPGRHPETCKDPLHLYRNIRTRFYSLVFLFDFLVASYVPYYSRSCKTDKNTYILIFFKSSFPPEYLYSVDRFWNITFLFFSTTAQFKCSTPSF